jgi:hypothetical protein
MLAAVMAELHPRLIRTARILLAHGADIHAVDSKGRSAHWHAMERRRCYPELTGMIACLLEHGARTDDENGRRLRAWAVREGWQDVVELFEGTSPQGQE